MIKFYNSIKIIWKKAQVNDICSCSPSQRRLEWVLIQARIYITQRELRTPFSHLLLFYPLFSSSFIHRIISTGWLTDCHFNVSTGASVMLSLTISLFTFFMGEKWIHKINREASEHRTPMDADAQYQMRHKILS